MSDVAARKHVSNAVVVVVVVVAAAIVVVAVDWPARSAIRSLRAAAASISFFSTFLRRNY